MEVDRPANPVHGDLSTNLAMQLARPLRMSPLVIANALATELDREAADSPASTPLAEASVAPPGFVNLRLADRALETVVGDVLADPGRWGRSAAATDARVVNVEFVSANPTGPLHVGNARGRVRRRPAVPRPRGRRPAGDARVLLQRLRGPGPESRRVRRARLPARRAGPGGRLPRRLRGTTSRRELPDGRLGGRRRRPAPRTAGVVGALGVGAGARRASRRAWRTWASTSTSGRAKARSTRRAGWTGPSSGCAGRGHVYEQDGALWFRSTAYGDDKDRVIIAVQRRADLLRGRHRLRDREVQPRLRPPHLHLGRGPPRDGRARAQRRGGDGLRRARPSRCCSIAWVRFVRDGQEVSMSKRAGEFITLDELLAEIGVDAARWFFASRGATSAIDFDIELAKKQSNENPVYYVQYAHARIASILRKAAEAGLAPADRRRRRARRRRSRRRPRPRARPAARRSSRTRPRPRRRRAITAFATELATTFHAFYRDARVVDVGRAGTFARPPGARGAERRRSRWRTRSACWGSRRPNRCRRGRRRRSLAAGRRRWRAARGGVAREARTSGSLLARAGSPRPSPCRP